MFCGWVNCTLERFAWWLTSRLPSILKSVFSYNQIWILAPYTTSKWDGLESKLCNVRTFWRKLNTWVCCCEQTKNRLEIDITQWLYLRTIGVVITFWIRRDICVVVCGGMKGGSFLIVCLVKDAFVHWTLQERTFTLLVKTTDHFKTVPYSVILPIAAHLGVTLHHQTITVEFRWFDCPQSPSC